MSASEVTLKLTCSNSAAQLAVVDGEFKVVDTGTSPWETKLAPGIYSLRARIGDAVHEQIEILREPGNIYAFDLKPPHFESALPIEATSTYHEYQHATPGQFTGSSQTVTLGQDAAFVLYVRDTTGTNFNAFTPEQQKAYEANFDGFWLLAADGTELVNFDQAAQKDYANGYIGAQIGLDPGAYVLAWQRNRERWCLPINAARNFSAQIYLRLQPVAKGSIEMRPDFRGASYVFDARSVGFDPARPDLNALESVRLAFERGRNVVEAAEMRMMLSEKFQNPMLGLYAAHLLLADEKRDLALLEEVIKNSTIMLGENFPDIVALAWGYERLTHKRPEDFGNRPWPELLGELKGPPLLMRSWDLLVACAQEVAPGKATTFAALSIAADLVAAGIYLVWQTRIRRGHTEMPVDVSRITLPESRRASTIGSVLADTSFATRSFDFAAKSVDRFAAVLPRALNVGVSRVRINAAEIRTPEDASKALQTLARKYAWSDVFNKFRGADKDLAQFTGLQRDLLAIMRQAATDRQMLRGLDTSFVQALITSNRIPIDSLAEALAGLDEAAAAV